MFNIDITRVATAAVGALVLSTMSVAAAVGPGHTAGTAQPVIASIHTGPLSVQGIRANG